MDTTLKDIQVFTNINFGTIRCVNNNGATLFAAIDIAKGLGYKVPKSAVIDSIPADEKTRLVISQPGSNYKSNDVFTDE